MQIFPAIYHKLPHGMAKKMFVLVMLFGAFLLLGLTFVITFISSTSLYDQTKKLLQAQTNQTLNIFEQYMENLKNIAFTAGNQESIRLLMRSPDAGYQRYIVDSYSYVQQIDDIYRWVDIYLFVINNNYIMGSKEGNVSNRIDITQSPNTKWYHQAKDNFSNILVVPDFTPPVTGSEDAFAVVLTMRKSEDWSIDGFVAVGLEKAALDDILTDTNFQKPAFLVILDKYGKLVYSSNPFLTDSNATMIPDIGYFEKKPDSFSDDSFHDYYLASIKSTFGDLRFISFYDKRYLNQDVFQLQLAVFVLVLISLFLLLVGAQVLSFRVVKPISQLIAFIHRAEASEFSQKLQIEAEDEVGQLVCSFNTMIDSIREHQILRRNAEFDALQKQIDPHFLYNTLESIKALAKRKNVKELCHTIDCLGDMFRYNTNRSNRSEVPIEDEIIHISNYLFIQQVRFGDRLRYRLDISPHILRMVTLRFILQPLVENAIRHGMEYTDKGFVLLIRAREADDSSIVFTVVDNGPGIPASKLHIIQKELSGSESHGPDPKKDMGVGLINITERLRLMYSGPYGLQIASSLGYYTKLTIRIPKIAREE